MNIKNKPIQKNILCLILLIVLTLFCLACSKTPKETPAGDTVSPQPSPAQNDTDISDTEKNTEELSVVQTPVKYSYDEKEFERAYGKALADIKSGKIPDTAAPSDPEATGFAVIPLGKEFYGIDAFAVLPVLKRALTDEEMLQLAYGMGSIDFDQLISPTYSLMKNDRELLENRPLFWEERIRKYELECLYRYEGKRPDQPLKDYASEGGPVSVMVNSEASESGSTFRYFIYPKAMMTDEQLLQVIDAQHPVPKEYYLPLPEEIQYSEVEKITDKLVSDYGVSDQAPEKCYPYYFTDRYVNSPIGSSVGYWTVRIHFKEGYDYLLEFDAADGSFLNWFRCPKGYFAENEPSDFVMEVIADSEASHSKDEIQAAAEAFVTQYLLKAETVISDIYLVPPYSDKIYRGDGLVIPGEATTAKVTLSTGEKYEVLIMNKDLSVQSLVKTD